MTAQSMTLQEKEEQPIQKSYCHKMHHRHFQTGEHYGIAQRKQIKSKNSQLAREIEIALPKELNREKQIELVREYIKDNFVDVGMCADIALHDKNDGNPHAHILLTMRPLNEDTTWGAKSKKEYILDENGEKVKLKNGNYKTRKINTTDQNEQDKAEEWRKAWADITNKYLKENSIQEKVDHRSYQRQGIEHIPTIHLGISATQMEKKGIVTDRGNINREIRYQNKILREISRRIKALLNWIRGIGKEEKAETENIKSTIPPKENLLSVFENLIRNNADNYNADLEKYIESYQLLKEKNITSLSQLNRQIFQNSFITKCRRTQEFFSKKCRYKMALHK